MKRLSLLLLFVATLAEAQTSRGGDWTSYSDNGCIGGTQCRGRSIRVQLEDRPVVAVRFRAHDNIGEKAGGEVRVRIDGNVVADDVDIPRRGDLLTFEVPDLYGRVLSIEPAADDEVEVSEVAVLYGRGSRRGGGGVGSGGGSGSGGNSPWDSGRYRDRSGWRRYPEASACIGGDQCRQNGRRITIALDDAPVLGVRFFAHDNIGQRADGKLRVRIDDEVVSFYIDVERAGRRHELDVDNVVGSKLVIEANDEEIDIKDIEVLYARGGSRRGGGGGRWEREIRDEGGCIGGSECGGRRARIRISLDGRPVDSIRFYARDDIGARAGGELRVRIDDEIVEWNLDIAREGRTYTINGGRRAGDYLYIEPAADDEVMIRDVRVTFADYRN